MLNKFKKYKFIFIKEDSLYAKEFKFKDFLLPVSIISICILLFASLVFFSKDVKDIITLKVISKHKKNNEELSSIINEQQKAIDVLIEEINSLYEKDENLRKLINLPAIDEDIRKLGVGGSEKEDKYNHLEYLIPLKIDLDNLNDKINFIKRSINLEKISYYAIGNKINEQVDYLLRYPAIYPVKKSDRKLMEPLKRKIQNKIDDSADWEVFNNQFSHSYPDFVNNLNRNYPNLRSPDIKLCCYMKMNMNTKNLK